MILIIDFGSQVTQLIARRIRELSVYCEIIPWDADILNTKQIKEAKALVLSGGPDSTMVKKSPTVSKRIFDLNIPILGICYGHQLICKLLGGKISKSEKREFGKTIIRRNSKNQSLLLKDLFKNNMEEVWMSHGDAVTALPEGPCPARSRFDWEPVFHENHQVTVRVTGQLPQGCRSTTYLSLLPHERYSASVIRSVLSEMGIIVSGGDRFEGTPEDARLIMRTTSPDLVSMVRDINKWSSNVMARQMLLTIGAEFRKEDDKDDRVAGIRTVYEWLENMGINTAGMVIDNGAGLTRHGRITARQGAQILQQAWDSPYASDLMASMPIIAMDGTMARRLRNTGMDGEGRIKTGYLENVRSIAGFTRDDNNTTWAIVGMVNNDPAWNGQAVLDRVLYSLHFRPPVGMTLSQSADENPASSIQ